MPENAKKFALLIGVSQYGEGLPELLATPQDVAILKRVLENPAMAEFDQVETLVNPDPVEIRLAIQRLYRQCAKDDLVLLYFSGHGITDDNNHLYFATRLTSKDDFEATAVPARFVQQQSMQCYARRQILILDCCYSGAFKDGWQTKAAGLDLRQELGGEGRVVLTSSTATQTSFQQESAELSLYTQYLVEGIETGAADGDRDGKIFVRELHDYVKGKVQEAKPNMKPDILLDREGFDILLSKAPRGDRSLDFRRLVEESALGGEISTYRRDILRLRQQEWGIAEEAAESIINSVLEPFRRRLVNLEQFKTALQEEVDHQFPLDSQLEADLRDWQRQVLGLADGDVAEIWHELTTSQPIEPVAQTQQEAQQQARQKPQEPVTLELDPPTTEIPNRIQKFKTQQSQPEYRGKLQLPLRNFEFDVVTLDNQGNEASRDRRQAHYFTEDLGQGIGLEMVAIPGGTFLMGSPDGEGASDERPQHLVTVPAFLMGKYPVTQAQWKTVAALPKVDWDLNSEPSCFKGDNRPVEMVSWNDAVEFCQRLSNQTGRAYRLPSEAEWEYACRAGTTTAFHFGENITTDFVNYAADFDCLYEILPEEQAQIPTTHVGSFPANAFGLYDIHGNVLEWCEDKWHNNYEEAPTDGSARLDWTWSNRRVLRGGSWYFFISHDCRSGFRISYDHDHRAPYIGFRLALI